MYRTSVRKDCNFKLHLWTSSSLYFFSWENLEECFLAPMLHRLEADLDKFLI